jgi:multidrug efflux system membrane fusion protein
MLLATMLGCSDEDKLIALPTPIVTVARPVEREMVDSAVFTGHTEGSEFVEVRARVSGYLAKVDFEPGNFIEKGARLFEIDPRPYQATLDQDEGELERTNARLHRTELDLTRGETLIARKVITKEEYDRLVADQAEAAAVVHSAEAAVERAKLDLEWTKIDAPISGIVSRELITVGNLVIADQTLLTTIVKHDPMYVYFDIDEHTVLKILDMIREGKFQSARQNKVPVRIGLADDVGYPIEGYVNFVENRLDRTSGTVLIRAEVPNPLLQNDSLRMTAGLFARVRLDLGQPYPALLVSEKSLLSDQDQKYVYVVNDKDEVERRDVKIGQLEQGYRVVLQGLQPTDRVITNGLQKVRQGAKVDAKETTLPGPEEHAVDSVNAAPGGTEQASPVEPATGSESPTTTAPAAADPAANDDTNQQP